MRAVGFSIGRYVGVCAAAVLLAACGTPRGALQHSMFPGLERYDDSHVAAALDTTIVLPRYPRASVAWFDQVADWYGQPMPEDDRQRLVDDLQRQLTAGPFAAVSVIPTTLASADSQAVDLSGLRSAAAHMQSDVVMLVLTTTQTDWTWNPLALTYPALLTQLFVPGDDVRVGVAAQACAIDVRTGLFLDCVQSHADEVDTFVIPARRGSAVRSLTASTTERALSDLPLRLRERLAVRLRDSVVQRSTVAVGRPVPAGVPYANRTD